MARGKKTGGRKRGTPNKATVERALLAERAAVEGKTAGQRLAKEVLEDFMRLFADMAATADRNTEQFEKWARLAIETAKALAPFQSPRYSTVAVAASTITKIEIVGGMSRRDFPELPAEIPLTDESGRPTVIEADPNGDADPDDIAEPTGPAAADIGTTAAPGSRDPTPQCGCDAEAARIPLLS